jgi:putative DNA primase/helicase
MTSDCLTAALRYARRGWHVFPLNGKHPYPGTHGHRDATTDVHEIKRMWKKYPHANVGIACNSETGPIVVDIDGGNGPKLAALLELPPTREATSQRAGRRHLYFDPMADGTTIKRAIKLKYEGVKYSLDILGDGGYVVAPPSVHPKTGKRYVWLSKAHCEPLPRSVLRVLRANRDDTKAAAPLPEFMGEGERDTLLTSLAGSMRRRGASVEAILAALREENATRCNPPLDDKQLRKIAKSIATKAPAGIGENLTDLGNARRFVMQHHENVRSILMQRSPWMIYNGQRWEIDTTGEVNRMAKTTVRSLYTEAAHATDGELRDQILKHAARSESAGKIRAIIELAATEPEVSIVPDGLDADPWLFNVANGTVDLRSGQLAAHNRADLLTRITDVEFDADARCERWDQFVLEIMNGDSELVDYLQRAVGYSLTGDTREECLFFGYGKGGNGKTKLFEVLRALCGGYSQQAEFNTFLARKSEGPRNDIARMRGARLITASEADGDRGFDGTVLKQLTGGDTVTARRLYEESFEFKPVHKLWLAANHKPIVKEQTEGFWRRIRLIPFEVTFEKRQRDNELLPKLMNELPGILNWAIAGAQRWRAEGLHEPKAVRRATRSYREENDLLGEFIEAHCILDERAWSPSTELYRVFSEWWTETRGPRSASISMGWFMRLLGEKSNIKPAKHDGTRGWRGIAINMEIGG